jgi:hypothetical protein
MARPQPSLRRMCLAIPPHLDFDRFSETVADSLETAYSARAPWDCAWRFDSHVALEQVEKLHEEGALNEWAFVEFSRMLGAAKESEEAQLTQKTTDRVILSAATCAPVLRNLADEPLDGPGRLYVLAAILRARNRIESGESKLDWFRKSGAAEFDDAVVSRFFGDFIVCEHTLFAAVLSLMYVALLRPWLLERCVGSLASQTKQTREQERWVLAASVVNAVVEDRLGKEKAASVAGELQKLTSAKRSRGTPIVFMAK